MEYSFIYYLGRLVDAGVVLVRLTCLAERLRDSWKAVCCTRDDLAMCHENELILGCVLYAERRLHAVRAKSTKI
jgi:hypothetical protein